MRAVELFAGAGGLAIGTALAGFKHELVLEWNHDACATIRANQDRGTKIVQGWLVFDGDVRSYDYSKFQEGMDLVAGGPPCQPFSLGGKAKGHEDVAQDEVPVRPARKRGM
jgi:DNA (cytosine-5)-methyltransferase 1